MQNESRADSIRAHQAGLRLLGVALTMAAIATAGTSAGAPTARAAVPNGECRLVQLQEPSGFYDGSVVDIEVVDGEVVYLGFSHEVERDKEHQRLFVWHGLTGAPVQVGPRGFSQDIGFELTPNGLVLGHSEDAAGTAVPWIQDLTTMELTFIDVDSGPRGADHGAPWLRRINSRGEIAGAVDRTPDPWDRGGDAVAFATPTSAMSLLPGSEDSLESGAFGINEAGARTGYIGRSYLDGYPDWLVFEPVIWEPDGAVVPLATPHGIEGAPRAIKDDGSVSGSIFWGEDPGTGHFEAAYWPRPDVSIGLGVLPDGGWSDVFGMDEGGWLVGAMDRIVDARKDRLAPDGFLMHSFLWTPATTANTVRILPSLYATAQGVDDWRRWGGSGTHGVNRDLDQVATGTHVGFRRGRPVQAPTVFLHASTCGVEVETTHDPFGLAATVPQESGSALAEAERHRRANPAGHGRQALGRFN